MFSVIIAAAGRGTRMELDKNKILHELCGKPILQYSLELFSDIVAVGEIIVVTGYEDVDEVRNIIKQTSCSAKVVVGGAERQDSIFNALKEVDSASSYVLIHDGARPFVEKAKVLNLIENVMDCNAAILAVPVKDTIKVVDINELVVTTPKRATLVAVQTPQGFEKDLLINAYDHAAANNYVGTDDASIVEYFGKSVRVVPGSYENIKITTPEDIIVGIELLRRRNGVLTRMKVPRIGFGYDVHQLVRERKLVLGGVDIPYEQGLLGHSDADVLLHAIKDALLGAAALGDIGKRFPDTDERYKNASSIKLLEQVVCLLLQNGFSINNIDATVAAQQPKLAPFIPIMRENIAAACGIDICAVNVKATTTEELGFVGRKEGISAYAVASII
ncbi:MAG: 2-C-methyl-D-erythritol 4-phosphate cytidylyltransferase [Negativicutes bacterium]|jgi:2-C-methyl-D-erythritol 4-phosphate cytidylyltransferase/2-C-methyl-D-erythritol 2,4-cyclodiphosphate synthase